jgi:hypothetical protein
MTPWSAGYVADIGYTYGYYTELNPVPRIYSSCLKSLTNHILSKAGAARNPNAPPHFLVFVDRN